jgi:hypothetical protein
MDLLLPYKTLESAAETKSAKRRSDSSKRTSDRFHPPNHTSKRNLNLLRLSQLPPTPNLANAVHYSHYPTTQAR